jgi:hypothetical protein
VWLPRSLRRSHGIQGIDMKSSLLALALLTASAALAPAQETTQGQMCATVAVMPPPAGNAPNRMLSNDAEVAGRVVVAKKTIAPGQAMGHGEVVLNASRLHHAAVEYRRSPTPPMVHTRMAEFFYVVDLVPENTVHYFTNIDKKQGLTVLDLHVPTPQADQF